MSNVEEGIEWAEVLSAKLGGGIETRAGRTERVLRRRVGKHRPFAPQHALDFYTENFSRDRFFILNGGHSSAHSHTSENYTTDMNTKNTSICLASLMMKQTIFRVPAILLFLHLQVSAQPEIRTWTFKTDYTGEAELLGVDEKQAILKFKNSSNVRSVPFEQLSDDDQKFIFKSDHFRRISNLLKNPGFETQNGDQGWRVDLWSHTDTRDGKMKIYESMAKFQISNEHPATGDQSLRVFSLQRKNNYPDEDFSIVSVRSNYLKIDKQKTYFVSGKLMVNKPLKNIKFIFSSPQYSDKNEHSVFCSGPLTHLESLEPGVWHQFDSEVRDFDRENKDREWKYLAVSITAYLNESQDDDFCFYVDDFYIGEKPEIE